MLERTHAQNTQTLLSSRIPRDTEHERYHPELEEELKECLFCLRRNVVHGKVGRWSVVLVLAGFVPVVSLVFASLPEAVLGGCTIMMFGNIILSGFQMISEAGYTQRNITIAALSLTIGIGFTQVGDIFANFPALFQSIFASNCIAVSFVVAVILNAVLPSEEHFLSAPQHQEA